MEIRRLSDELKRTYGQKIYRLSLSSGCTCPNRDGTVGYGGCSFCSMGGSGEFAAPLLPPEEQIRLAKERVRGKMPSGLPEEDWRFIAYYQAFTNTYGDPERLKALYSETLRQKEICILDLGTRPDCLGPEIMDMLRELNQIKPVWVELGLQTVHERTAERINRGYALPVFEEAWRNLKDSGLTGIVHVILGLPGESADDMVETCRYLAALDPPPDGIKLQLLHVLKGTSLAEEYRREPFPIMSLEEYADVLIRCLKVLPEETVIHRITGDGPKRLLIAPKWSGDKKRVLNYLNKRIREA